MTYKRHILRDQPDAVPAPGRVGGLRQSVQYSALCGQRLLLPRDKAQVVAWENARRSSSTVCKSCLASRQKLIRVRRARDGSVASELRKELLKLRDALGKKDATS